jgi:hypothetical protein
MSAASDPNMKPKPKNYRLWCNLSEWDHGEFSRLVLFRRLINISRNGDAADWVEFLAEHLHRGKVTPEASLQILSDAIQNRGLDLNGYYRGAHLILHISPQAQSLILNAVELDFSLPLFMDTHESLFESNVFRSWRSQWICDSIPFFRNAPVKLFNENVIWAMMMNHDNSPLFCRFEPFFTGDLWAHCSGMMLQTMQYRDALSSDQTLYLIMNVNRVYARLTTATQYLPELKFILCFQLPVDMYCLICKYLWMQNPEQLFETFLIKRETVISNLQYLAERVGMTLQNNGNSLQLIEKTRCVIL